MQAHKIHPKCINWIDNAPKVNYNITAVNFYPQNNTSAQKSQERRIYMSIGERVRKLREERGMTQAELAQKVGSCQKTMIASIEKGTKALPLATAITMAEVFGITLDELCRKEV